jgi:hypothetical protein
VESLLEHDRAIVEAACAYVEALDHESGKRDELAARHEALEEVVKYGSPAMREAKKDESAMHAENAANRVDETILRALEDDGHARDFLWIVRSLHEKQLSPPTNFVRDALENLSSGKRVEMLRSGAGAELFRMHPDELVRRRDDAIARRNQARADEEAARAKAAQAKAMYVRAELSPTLESTASVEIWMRFATSADADRLAREDDDDDRLPLDVLVSRFADAMTMRLRERVSDSVYRTLVGKDRP